MFVEGSIFEGGEGEGALGLRHQKMHGTGAFVSMATKTWNNIKSQIKDPMINTFFPNKLKMFLFDFYLNLIKSKGLLFYWDIGMHNISFGWFFWGFLRFFVLSYFAITAKGFWLFYYQLTCSK